MSGLQSSPNKTLFIEFIQFLTPKRVLPHGVCIVVSIQLNASHIRIILKLFVKLWGKKKVFLKAFDFDV
jgi:hypothetical protein